MPPKRKSGPTTRRMSLGGDPKVPVSNPPSPQGDKRRPKRSATSMNKISPAKPSSRLQPSQPLHMTTRRAASKAATNSNASSIGSAGSRRSSLNDATQLTGGADIDAHRPTKKARLSDRSSTTTHSKSFVQPRVQSRSPDLVADSNQDQNIPDIVAPLDVPLIEQLEDATLLEGGPVINGRQDDGESDVQRLLSPLPKRRGRGRPKARRVSSPAGSFADSFAPGTPVTGDALDIATDRDVPKATKKLPGRRRAPNADPFMEACLRRQLQLRVGHRAVSKALKPVLLELARRTTIQLARQDDADVLEAEKFLKIELQRKLDARLRIIENENRIKSQYLSESLKRDEEELAIRYKDRVLAVQEDYDVRLEHRILQLGRQYEHERDEDATDDENGDTIHPLHGRPTKSNPTGTLDARYDSRSRFFLETKRLGQRGAQRTKIGLGQAQALNDQIEDVVADASPIDHVIANQFPESFGSFDHARRKEVMAILGVHALIEASNDIERQAFEEEQRLRNAPNSDASGLQTLAAAIEMEHKLASSLKVPIHLLHFKPQLPLGSSTPNQGDQIKVEGGLEQTSFTIQHVTEAPQKLESELQDKLADHKSSEEHEEQPSTPRNATPRSSRRRRASLRSSTGANHSDNAIESPSIANQHESPTRKRSRSINKAISCVGHSPSSRVAPGGVLSADQNTRQVLDKFPLPVPDEHMSIDAVHHDQGKDFGLATPTGNQTNSGVNGTLQKDAAAPNVLWPATRDERKVDSKAVLDCAQSNRQSDSGAGIDSAPPRPFTNVNGVTAYPLDGQDVARGGTALARQQRIPPQRGVFFGPPPPPQFGHRTTQHPWYRQ